MQEVEDGDTTAWPQHANKFAKRLIAPLPRGDVVNHGQRDDRVESRVGERQFCDIPGFHLDPVASLSSMRLLKQLAEDRDAELFFSHDAESYAGWVKAPGFYS